ncbi:alpha-ketoglutarate-dependent dioxygenase FTO-like isoform X1 [Sinocyclocheilus anshuiensis]|uniref:Alpha-ketoglutarate-dependent dioxygenase FTO n=2 Tax=Sinocyclocheilus anshuiensis TaxID=1608454 RepID=A0A671R220_9TELE|nr:PREDICTED: alpha-ketoglutarate-dependent dioxygenase FTO-like isoform X1 [Sinocyclocheilus anshuiensis]
MKLRQRKQYFRNMKRSDDSEREKRRKRRRLIQELGEQRTPYLSPADPGFQELWDSSYAGLALRQSSALPDGLHERVQSALRTLQRRGCLLRDLVRVRDRDVFTAVSRALVGQPGHTYRYLDTRLFTIPWHCEGEEGQKDEKDKPCCDSDLRDACKALWELNQFFCSDVKQQTNARGVKRSRSDTENSEDTPGEGMCEESVKDRLLEEKQEEEEEEEEDSGQGCSHSSPPSSALPPDVAGLVQFNITLINYMDTTAMTQLKEEPYYGMGKMAVGWHHDENLVPLSPVAVYSYSCPAEPKNEGATEKDGEGQSKEKQKQKQKETETEGEGTSKEELKKEEGEGSEKEEVQKEKACWRVGLKVAWDIHTPGLALPLQSGDCYYMTDDLNRTHQHCVLAGDTARFSSTHRVVQCCTGTLDYIQKRSSEALENLHTDPEKNTKSLKSLLPSTLQHIEDIHNEVEFEWLRQYWFQGRRFARFCSWWTKPMEQMEKDWKEMERMTQLLLAVVEDENTAQENRREMADILLNALTDRQQHRQTWRDRCQSSLAQTLPPEEAPVDRPYWSNEDPDMPLPFDLSEIINRVESLLWRM